MVEVAGYIAALWAERLERAAVGVAAARQKPRSW
jgi:hypothetical protein